MVKEHKEVLPTWVIAWQAALTPDPMMIPTEDIFLLDSVTKSNANKVSLTATIDNIPGLLFHSPEAILCHIRETGCKPTKKLAQKHLTKFHKKSQRRSIITK